MLKHNKKGVNFPKIKKSMVVAYMAPGLKFAHLEQSCVKSLKSIIRTFFLALSFPY